MKRARQQIVTGVNPVGNPNFQPKWKNTPTVSRRMPEKFASLLMDLARKLDDGSVSVAEVERLIIDKNVVLDNLEAITKVTPIKRRKAVK